jgi:hypothetical protein
VTLKKLLGLILTVYMEEKVTGKDVTEKKKNLVASRNL